MRHADLMFPLQYRRKSKVRTACNKTAPWAEVAAVHRGEQVNCPECQDKLRLLRQQVNFAREKAVLNSTVLDKLMLRIAESVSTALGENPKEVWWLRAEHTYEERTYYVFERADSAFWTFGLTKEEPQTDHCFVYQGDADAAAQRFIDQAILNDNASEKD